MSTEEGSMTEEIKTLEPQAGYVSDADVPQEYPLSAGDAPSRIVSPQAGRESLSI
jgi:hypothetical protein